MLDPVFFGREKFQSRYTLVDRLASRFRKVRSTAGLGLFPGQNGVGIWMDIGTTETRRAQSGMGGEFQSRILLTMPPAKDASFGATGC